MEWLRSYRPDLVPRYERLYAHGAYAPKAERDRLSGLGSPEAAAAVRKRTIYPPFSGRSSRLHADRGSRRRATRPRRGARPGHAAGHPRGGGNPSRGACSRHQPSRPDRRGRRVGRSARSAGRPDRQVGRIAEVGRSASRPVGQSGRSASRQPRQPARPGLHRLELAGLHLALDLVFDLVLAERRHLTGLHGPADSRRGSGGT